MAVMMRVAGSSGNDDEEGEEGEEWEVESGMKEGS